VNYSNKTRKIFYQDTDDFIGNSICKFMAAYRIKKLRLCLVIQLSFGLLVALWYFVETPGSPKVDVWIIIIEFVISPVWMRYFTVKWNEKQSQ
jgi:hypothetical protein